MKRFRNSSEYDHDPEISNITKTRGKAKKLEWANYSISTIWGAFDILLKKWKNWENVYMYLNGKKVYSFGVNTIDDLYLQYYWKTKSEMDKEKKEPKKEQEKKESNLEENAQRFDSLIEKWKHYIDEKKWQEWVEYESTFKKEMFSLDVIDRVVQIMEMLDKWINKKEIRKKMIDERHGEWYYSIRKTVIHFSKYWKNFEKMSKNWATWEPSSLQKIVNNVREGFEDLFR